MEHIFVIEMKSKGETTWETISLPSERKRALEAARKFNRAQRPAHLFRYRVRKLQLV